HIGVDLVKNRATKAPAENEAEKIMYHCLRNGVALKVIEGNILTMRPSLIINRTECDMIITTLTKALEEIK
ncbi:MAG TPA: hypothetical protein VFV68_02250, partial [Agriterribacter sp.]|nr:hypothetical protein [Agriterribacter sp.]